MINWKIVIIIICLIATYLLIPIFIILVYSTKEPSIIAPWSAADLLIYMGTGIGGLSTLLAVYLTIANEMKIRHDEKIKDARVLITMMSYILFNDFDKFCKYSEAKNISRFYYFQDWVFQNDVANELKWILQRKNDSTSKNRFVAFIIGNPTNILILNIEINVFCKDKQYKPIRFSQLMPYDNVAFPLPVSNEVWPEVNKIEISYMTKMHECMEYVLEYVAFDGDSTKTSTKENYYIVSKDGKKQPCLSFDTEQSMFHDLRKG